MSRRDAIAGFQPRLRRVELGRVPSKKVRPSQMLRKPFLERKQRIQVIEVQRMNERPICAGLHRRTSRVHTVLGSTECRCGLLVAALMARSTSAVAKAIQVLPKGSAVRKSQMACTARRASSSLLIARSP